MIPSFETHLSCSVTLEKREPFFGEDHFSGAATKKKRKRAPLNNSDMQVHASGHQLDSRKQALKASFPCRLARGNTRAKLES